MSNIFMYGAVALIIFLALDALWLGLIAKTLYTNQIGGLMHETPVYYIAGISYLIFILGLTFFVINPAIADGNIAFAILAALFFGFTTYAVYNLTNLSTLADWPISITLIDIAWGSVLTTLTSLFTYLIFTAF